MAIRIDQNIVCNLRERQCINASFCYVNNVFTEEQKASKSIFLNNRICFQLSISFHPARNIYDQRLMMPIRFFFNFQYLINGLALFYVRFTKRHIVWDNNSIYDNYKTSNVTFILYQTLLEVQIYITNPENRRIY